MVVRKLQIRRVWGRISSLWYVAKWNPCLRQLFHSSRISYQQTYEPKNNTQQLKKSSSNIPPSNVPTMNVSFQEKDKPTSLLTSSDNNNNDNNIFKNNSFLTRASIQHLLSYFQLLPSSKTSFYSSSESFTTEEQVNLLKEGSPIHTLSTLSAECFLDVPLKDLVKLFEYFVQYQLHGPEINRLIKIVLQAIALQSFEHQNQKTKGRGGGIELQLSDLRRLLSLCGQLNYFYVDCSVEEKKRLLSFLDISIHREEISSSFSFYCEYFQAIHCLLIPWRQFPSKSRQEVLSYLPSFQKKQNDLSHNLRVEEIAVLVQAMRPLYVFKDALPSSHDRRFYTSLLFQLIEDVYVRRRPIPRKTEPNLLLFSILYQLPLLLKDSTFLLNDRHVEGIFYGLNEEFEFYPPDCMAGTILALGYLGIYRRDIPRAIRGRMMDFVSKKFLDNSNIKHSLALFRGLALMEWEWENIPTEAKFSLCENLNHHLIQLRKESFDLQIFAHLIYNLGSIHVNWKRDFPLSLQDEFFAVFSKCCLLMEPEDLTTVLTGLGWMNVTWSDIPSQIQGRILTVLNRSLINANAQTLSTFLIGFARLKAKADILSPSMKEHIEYKIVQNATTFSPNQFTNVLYGLSTMHYSLQSFHSKTREALATAIQNISSTLNEKNVAMIMYALVMLSYDCIEKQSLKEFISFHSFILKRFFELESSILQNNKRLHVGKFAMYFEWLPTIPPKKLSALSREITSSADQPILFPSFINDEEPVSSPTHLHFSQVLSSTWQEFISSRSEDNQLFTELVFLNEYCGLKSRIFPVDITIQEKESGKIIAFIEIDGNPFRHHYPKASIVGEEHTRNYRAERLKMQMYHFHYPDVPFWRIEGAILFGDVEIQSKKIVKRIANLLQNKQKEITINQETSQPLNKAENSSSPSNDCVSMANQMTIKSANGVGKLASNPKKIYNKPFASRDWKQ